MVKGALRYSRVGCNAFVVMTVDTRSPAIGRGGWFDSASRLVEPFNAPRSLYASVQSVSTTIFHRGFPCSQNLCGMLYIWRNVLSFPTSEIHASHWGKMVTKGSGYNTVQLNTVHQWFQKLRGHPISTSSPLEVSVHSGDVRCGKPLSDVENYNVLSWSASLHVVVGRAYSMILS